MNEYHESFDGSPYWLFVLPNISKELALAGMSTDVIFWWRRNEDRSLQLCTYFFDTDNLYKEAQKQIDVLNPPLELIPAYTLKDIENIIPPGYLVSRTGTGVYEIMLDKMWKVSETVAPRLPDAFALMLLKCLGLGIVDLKEANARLKSSLG